MNEQPPSFPPLDDVHAHIDFMIDLHPGFESLVAPSVVLRPSSEASSTRTHFYGQPLVPEDFSWPHSPERPMAFVGQIDFAELWAVHRGEIPHMPRKGVLSLFYDVEASKWGYSPGEEAYWTVVYLPEPEDGERAAPPMELEHRVVGAQLESYPTLPGPWDAHLPDMGPDGAFDTEKAERLDDAIWDLHGRLPSPRHQVGGHAKWIQDDPRVNCARLLRCIESGRRHLDERSIREARREVYDWNLLWAIDGDRYVEPRFQWGDSGSLYLMIRDEDLEARNFERAHLVLQCY